ncbi:MAG: TM0106 family RecB-like putative nuclease [Acidobacteria bacterium]|nr:TM0106 family RecB-like putative nuclease [Acidobacteriota bacterium]
MSGPVPAARVRATDLYDLAVCPHRIALDRRLPREARTPPAPATAQLLAYGLALEAEVAAALGYPQPEHPPGDFAEGARQTRALLESGVPGVYQAVLYDGRHLAVPDLLRRVDGASRLGAFHYEPGDVKAGLSPRADQVLQVVYAGRLLGELQGRDPDHGFLVLGDRREERFPLGELRHVLASAVAQVEAIVERGATGGAEGGAAGSSAGGTAADGGETFPFLGPGCAGCRWRGTCVPDLLARQDLSLVDGMTRTRRRLLVRHGVDSVPALAALDPAAWRAAGRPPLGLDLLTRQAAALLERRVALTRPLELPALPAGALLLHLERDPLDADAVALAAWAPCDARGAAGPAAVRILRDAADRAAAAVELAALLDAAPRPLFHFGGAAPGALDALAEAAGLDPRRQAGLAAHLCDLAAALRRAASFLPVWRYELEQVDAALGGAPLPGPDEADEPAFLYAAFLRDGVPGAWGDALRELGERRLARLARVASWMLAR